MKQTNIYTLALAALMLIPASCSDEQYTAALAPGQQPGNGASGPLITVTATQGDRPQTRLGYDDPNDPTQPIAVTWAEEDKFYVGKDFSAFTGETSSLSVATAYFSPFTLKEGDAGYKMADFEGSAPAEMQNDDPLYAIYGDGAGRITLNKEEAGTLSFDYTKQRQTANGDKTHLSGVDFMVATTTYKTDKQPVFAFTHLGAMMKFTLTLPTEGLTVKELTLTTTNDTKPFSDVAQWDKAGTLAFSKTKTASASTTLLLGQEETGITLTDTKILTAYMMVAPTTLTKESASMTRKTLKLQVTGADGVVYIANFKGADIEQGKYYTVEATPKIPVEEMSFTITVDAKNLTFQPFVIEDSDRVPAGFTLDWGDGSKPTTLYTDNLFEFFKPHTYKSAGTYTITITCSQMDTKQQQIAPLNFKGETRLVSLNTPMLNSGGQQDFSRFFEGCSNLASLPEGLFDKHTEAKNFYSCFNGCSKLTSLPEGLFDKNTAATNFRYCFYGCTNLTSLPPGLFDKNTKVTNFECCFYGCTNLTSLPPGLFDHNTWVKNFKHCFSSCTNLASLPPGLFDKNTAATDFSNCFKSCTNLASLPPGLFDKNTAATDFSNCFNSCTNLASLPEGLFDKNTAATNFSYCFNNCKILLLNDKVFSSTAVLNRFRDKNVNFSYCFYSVGFDLCPDQWSQSVAPPLWDYYPGDTGDWTKTKCYGSCLASNMGSLTGYWR